MAIKRFEDVTQAALEAVLGGLEVPTDGYRALFPQAFTSNLSWETLSSDGNMTVAADVVAHDASVKLKSRPDTVLQTGSIPKMGLLNKVTEKQLHDLYALQNNPRNLENEIYRIIFGDIPRAYGGVHARLEMLAMKAVSTGVVTTTQGTDNNGINVTATYGIPDANKSGVPVVWSSASTATPIADLKAKAKAMKAAGFSPQRILMDEATFDNLVAADEVKAMYSGLLGLSAALLNPNVEQINTVLVANRLPAITIVDSAVAIEGLDGAQSIVNPWSTGKVAFLSTPTAGRIQWTLTAEEKMQGYNDPAAITANRDLVRITRWNEKNPFAVFTKGEAVAFPVLDNPKGIFLLNTANVTTWE
jgi:hypothetical protein